jgi:hypothetical protein
VLAKYSQRQSGEISGVNSNPAELARASATGADHPSPSAG